MRGRREFELAVDGQLITKLSVITAYEQYGQLGHW